MSVTALCSRFAADLFSVFFLLFAVNGDADHYAAADKQQCDPEDHIAVVTGLRRILHRCRSVCPGSVGVPVAGISTAAFL